jgi:hypothetical protein
MAGYRLTGLPLSWPSVADSNTVALKSDTAWYCRATWPESSAVLTCLAGGAIFGAAACRLWTHELSADRHTSAPARYQFLPGIIPSYWESV